MEGRKLLLIAVVLGVCVMIVGCGRDGGTSDVGIDSKKIRACSGLAGTPTIGSIAVRDMENGTESVYHWLNESTPEIREAQRTTVRHGAEASDSVVLRDNTGTGWMLETSVETEGSIRVQKLADNSSVDAYPLGPVVTQIESGQMRQVGAAKDGGMVFEGNSWTNSSMVKSVTIIGSDTAQLRFEVDSAGHPIRLVQAEMELTDTDGSTTRVPRSVQEFANCQNIEASKGAIRSTFNLAKVYPRKLVLGVIPTFLS